MEISVELPLDKDGSCAGSAHTASASSSGRLESQDAPPDAPSLEVYFCPPHGKHHRCQAEKGCR